MSKKICVTGSNGLIGSAVCQNFLNQGWQVYGVDNNMRQEFFGTSASTDDSKLALKKNSAFTHLQIDIRDDGALKKLFRDHTFEAVVHCAAQPSHDKAKEIPRLDFEVNALGTLNLLEMTRLFCPQAPFVFTSTNKVYGDNPNQVPLRAGRTRYHYASQKFKYGIPETLSVDHTTHSLFGASKLSADVYVQEYSRYFGLKTMLLRLGCVTGPMHASVKLHGFLSYLIKSLYHHGTYEIIGYQGMQVRDQIDAVDVAHAIALMVKSPRSGAVYNLGGGLKNNASILELLKILERKLQRSFKITYTDQARVGDHICYISDTRKFEHDYPQWRLSRSLDQIIDDLIAHEKNSSVHLGR